MTSHHTSPRTGCRHMHRLITSPVTTKLPITFAIIILSFRRIPCHRQITIIYMETEKIPPRDTTGLVEQSQYPPKKPPIGYQSSQKTQNHPYTTRLPAPFGQDKGRIPLKMKAASTKTPLLQPIYSLYSPSLPPERGRLKCVRQSDTEYMRH